MENPSTRIWRYALIGLLVLGIAYRFYAVATWKKSLSNDESVSYMCASATAGIWETEIGGMVNMPLTVADIQRFYERPVSFAFHTVSMDMALYDVHPPFYFWLLHIMHVLWGTGAATGAYLNILFGIAALFLVLRLARSVLPGPIAPYVAAVAWYLSPAVVQIDLEARPYQLLTALALASYLLGLRVINGQPSRTVWTGFAVVNMLGLLTHLYFPFLLLPGTALVLWEHGLGRRTRQYVASLLGSLVGMLVLYPEFITFLTSYGDRPRDVPEPVEHLERFKGVFYASMQFFTEARAMRYLLLALCGLGIGYSAWQWRRSGRAPLARTPEQMYLLVTFGWWSFFTVVLFLIGVSPAQAVGEQYFAYLWPFLAVFCTGILATVADRALRRILLGLYLVQLTIAFYSGVRGSEYLLPAIPPEWDTVIASSDLLVTDEAKRTALPRISRQLPGELPLYIMGRERPDLMDKDRVVFLHLAIDSRPAQPFVDWMADRDFHPIGDVRTSDRYELRSFARHDQR
ncbi:MAG: glycosyltransferase family 39 protein [Flavobacteriales bacterium]|nr:glycosyltransferase family 39 protein [Flavobacteriales bacterium]